MTKEDDGRMRRKMREGEREMHERRRHGRRGQKKKCIFTWSHDRPRNLIPSDRPQRRGNEATRKNNGPVVVRVTSSSSACRGSAHALEFHRGNVERRLLSLSLSLLVPSSLLVGKAWRRKQSTRYTRDVTDTCSSRLSRSFPPRGYSSLVFPNLYISKNIFLSEINYAENFVMKIFNVCVDSIYGSMDLRTKVAIVKYFHEYFYLILCGISSIIL